MPTKIRTITKVVVSSFADVEYVIMFSQCNITTKMKAAIKKRNRCVAGKKKIEDFHRL